MNIKKFLISFLLIFFGLLIKNSSVWACPVGVGGCVEWTSSHVCNTAGLSNQCIYSGGDYWGMVKVAQNNCAGGAGCGPGRDCYWSPVWNGACGDCCWGGSDPQPTCTGVTISTCVDEGGNYVAQADGVQDATSVKFPTWSLADGQDDLVWYSDSSGPPWSVTINQSNHTGGSIATHVYLNNNSYTNEWCGGATVAVPCILPAPENLATSCRNNGNTVDFSWNSVSGAASYVLRLNKDPAGDWMGPGDQWLTPTGTNESASIDCGYHYGWSLQPVKPGESYPYSGLYAGSDFTCPCTTPKTWTITTEAVCTNGMTHNRPVTSWYRIWPPNPVQDTTVGSKIGPNTFNVTSTEEENNVYVGMYKGSWLQVNPPLPHSAIISGSYWGGIPNAKWDRENLPEGSYRIEFQVPSSWCPTPTPPPDPISFYLHGVSNADACENSTSSENPSSSNIPIKKSGTTIANFSASNNAAVNYDPADEDGQYSITPPSGWVCACSISGANQWPNCSLAAYNETIQWSITEVAESWWQTKGGNVHSQASINVDIPIDLTQQLSLSDNGAVGVITSDGTIGNNLIDAWKYPDNYGFNFDDNPIDYEFFWLQAGGPNTTNLSSTISQGDLVSGDTVFYINGDLALSDGNWNNTVNNRQVVVFVNGNLTIPKFEIPSHNLNIGNKGFLAFIVSGNINISAGHEDPSNDDVEIHGIFIADGDINITGEKNLRFVGKGIFAAGVDGNGSVTFNRDLGIDNNLFPPVLFIWDPELILNAPQILMQNYTSWHEVAPVGN